MRQILIPRQRPLLCHRRGKAITTVIEKFRQLKYTNIKFKGKYKLPEAWGKKVVIEEKRPDITAKTARASY